MKRGVMAMVLGVLVTACLGLSSGTASGQTVSCPAGAPGATGGQGGTTENVGNGGFGLFATASGWYGGDVSGGDGGAGGSGLLPVCNQTVTGGGGSAVLPDTFVAAPSGSPANSTVLYPVGSGGGRVGGNPTSGTGNFSLASTGNQSDILGAISGMLLIIGGVAMVYGQGTASRRVHGWR